MSIVLCVAEKPSIAKILAKILDQGGVPRGGGGGKQRLPVHHVNGRFEVSHSFFFSRFFGTLVSK